MSSHLTPERRQPEFIRERHASEVKIMFTTAHYGTTKSGPPCCDSTVGGGFCPEMRHQRQQLDKSPLWSPDTGGVNGVGDWWLHRDRQADECAKTGRWWRGGVQVTVRRTNLNVGAEAKHYRRAEEDVSLSGEETDWNVKRRQRQYRKMCTISRGSVWGIIITLMVSAFSYFNLVIHMRSFFFFYWLPGIYLLCFSLSNITAYVHCFPFCLRVKSRNLVLLHFSLLAYCHWLLLH